MAIHYNIDFWNHLGQNPLVVQEQLKEIKATAMDTFVFTGMVPDLSMLDMYMKAYRGFQNIRPHYLALKESLTLLSFRLYFELPDSFQDRYPYRLGEYDPVLRATWYLYRLNGFRGTKIPMIRIGDHAKIFFGYYIVNIVPESEKEKEEAVIEIINQTKWKYLAPRIFSVWEKGYEQRSHSAN